MQESKQEVTNVLSLVKKMAEKSTKCIQSPLDKKLHVSCAFNEQQRQKQSMYWYSLIRIFSYCLLDSAISNVFIISEGPEQIVQTYSLV